MSRNETFDLSGPVGRLEAVLMHPGGAPQAAAVVCHAHPLHGGILHHKVVFRAAKALQEAGLAVLRFNFRSAGRSQGEHDGGRGEQDDTRAAVDELERRFPGLAVMLGGFSFGAVMALLAGAADARVRALFALGFPVRLAGSNGFLDGCTKPRLFVQGEHDEFGSAEQLEAYAGGLPEPKHIVILPGGNHFFDGQLDELHAAVAAWTAGRPWEVS